MRSKKDTLQYKIYETLDESVRNYESGNIQIVEGLYFSQFKTIRLCEFYSNSTYIENKAPRFGSKQDWKNKDSLGRDKPFYNIVNYRVSLAKTATDLDIKDINIVSDNPEYWVKAMFLNKEVYEWMKRTNFSLTLNKMGYTRPKYGGYLVKKTLEEVDGEDELKIGVVEWKNVYTNQVDILNNPIIERHYMSPVDLMKKEGTWNNVKDVLIAYKKLKDNKNETNTIDVYEILGEFPKSFYAQFEGDGYSDSDEYEYSLQKYFIAQVGEEKFKLYCEELTGEKITDTYDYLPWEEMSGRGLGKGVIEDSEEAQVWTNDAIINEKIAMDLAGRVGIKTNSKKLGNNILEHDHGKIYELSNDEDINSFNLAPAALGNYQNLIEKWRVQADNVTSSFDAATGETPPSGTPLGTTQLLNAVATKPFDYRREEWGIHLSKMFERWVIPFVVKKLYSGHTLRSDYSDEELKIIDDSIYAKNHNQVMKELTLKGQLMTEEDQAGIQSIVGDELQKFGKTRFIKFPDGYFDDIEAQVTIVTTGEQKNKAAIMQSLSTLLDTVIKSYNPNTGTFGVLEDPKLSKIFGTIVEMSQSGINPIGLGLGSPAKSFAKPQSTPSPVQPQVSEPLATQ